MLSRKRYNSNKRTMINMEKFKSSLLTYNQSPNKNLDMHNEIENLRLNQSSALQYKHYHDVPVSDTAFTSDGNRLSSNHQF